MPYGSDSVPGVHGVEVDVICGNVPVVSMEKESIFSENASWMLQSAMESSGKADSLYEDCRDEDIESACRSLGFSKDEIYAVKVKGQKNVRAVGGNGKRSVMLACVVAMSVKDPDGLDDLWEGLRSFKIHREYWELMELVNNSTGKSASAPSKGGEQWGSKRKYEDDGDWTSKKKQSSNACDSKSWTSESVDDDWSWKNNKAKANSSSKSWGSRDDGDWSWKSGGGKAKDNAGFKSWGSKDDDWSYGGGKPAKESSSSRSWGSSTDDADWSWKSSGDGKANAKSDWADWSTRKSKTMYAEDKNYKASADTAKKMPSTASALDAQLDAYFNN